MHLLLPALALPVVDSTVWEEVHRCQGCSVVSDDDKHVWLGIKVEQPSDGLHRSCRIVVPRLVLICRALIECGLGGCQLGAIVVFANEGLSYRSRIVLIWVALGECRARCRLWDPLVKLRDSWYRFRQGDPARWSDHAHEVAYISTEERECVWRRPYKCRYVTRRVAWYVQNVQTTIVEIVVGLVAPNLEAVTEGDFDHVAVLEVRLVHPGVFLGRVPRKESLLETRTNHEISLRV